MPTIVAFTLIIGLLVFFHELGHFIVAKLTGIMVYEFAIGFGPRILRFRRKGTDYTLRLLPLGGFVKLAGMDAAESELDNIEEDDPRSFNNKPLLVRLSTIAAGPIMNLLLAALIFTLYFALIIIPPTIVAVVPGKPAEQAGIQPGDQILAVNGVKVSDLDYLVAQIEASPGKELDLQIKRDQQIINITVVPENEQGQGILGVSLNEKQKIPLLPALRTGFEQTWFLIQQTYLAVVRMITGKAKLELAGPIGMYRVVGSFSADGLGGLLIIAATLSINLGLLNLLPVPVLDGGWLIIFIIEAIRRKPFKEEHRAIILMIGLVILLGLMVYATYSDIVNLFT